MEKSEKRVLEVLEDKKKGLERDVEFRAKRLNESTTELEVVKMCIKQLKNK